MQKCSSEAVPSADQAVRRPNEYVGYIRVSSKEQEREGDSLECQLDQIQAYASAKGAKLLKVFEDAASAFNSSSSNRPGLRDAINEALRVGVPLLVPSIDRLSRSLKDLTLLDQEGLSIHSADRGKVSKAVLEGHIARAQAESAAKAARTTQQHASGFRRKNKPSAASAAARRQGTISNILRKDQRIREVADFINATPAAEDMTRQQLVDALNNAGVLNLRSVRGEVRKPWTKEALRPVQKAATELIASEAEMDADEMMLAEGRSKTDGQPTAVEAPDLAEECTAIPALRPDALVDCLGQALQADISAPRALSKAERLLLLECIRRKLVSRGMQVDFQALKQRYPSLVNAFKPTYALAPRVLIEMRRIFEDQLRS